MLFEGDIDCVKRLLMPVERILKVGRDIYREGYDKRLSLWKEVEEHYDWYLSGECGNLLSDLDKMVKGKFEAALALLALSFRINNEKFNQRRFNDDDLTLIDEVTKFNVFEILTVDDILKKLYRRDSDVYDLLRTYYLGLDKWIEERILDPSISLNLRGYIKHTWQRYKEKLNQAFAEASKYDWFRTILEDWEKEKSEIVEDFSLRVRELDEKIKDMRREFESEKAKLIENISQESKSEIERLKREKEELVRKFEIERERIAREIAEMKDNELQEKLQKQLELERSKVLAEIREMEERLREKELELQAKEREVERKDEELRRKIAEIMNIQESVEKGTRLVKADEAKMMEINFIERLKSKLKEIVINESKFRANVMDEIKIPLDDDSPEELTILSVEMKEKRLLGGERFRIYALFFIRPGKFAEMGFDTDPVELGEVEKVLSRFRKSKNRFSIVIASPLGFENRVKRFVNSDEFYRNFYSERISLLLLDTETNEVIFNPNDSFAKSISKYVQLEIEPEVYAKVRNCILSKLGNRDYLPLSEALGCGDEEYVRRAFYEVAGEIGGDVKYIEGFDLVLIRR